MILKWACEVNDKETRDKNDGNEPEQNELSKSVEPDKPMTIETRRGGRKKTSSTSKDLETTSRFTKESLMRSEHRWWA